MIISFYAPTSTSSPRFIQMTQIMFFFLPFTNMKDNKSIKELSPWEVAIASSFSKVVASILTYPHEVRELSNRFLVRLKLEDSLSF